MTAKWRLADDSVTSDSVTSDSVERTPKITPQLGDRVRFIAQRSSPSFTFGGLEGTLCRSCFYNTNDDPADSNGDYWISDHNGDKRIPRICIGKRENFEIIKEA